MKRSLKNSGVFMIILALLALLFATFFSGCRANKPTVITRDSIIEKTTISYRDTIIRDTVPGEKVTLVVPCDQLPLGSVMKRSGHVHLSVTPKGKELEIKCEADSLIRVNKAQLTLINQLKRQVSEAQVVKVVERVPWWTWMIMGVTSCFTCLYIIRIKTSWV